MCPNVQQHPVSHISRLDIDGKLTLKTYWLTNDSIQSQRGRARGRGSRGSRDASYVDQSNIIHGSRQGER